MKIKILIMPILLVAVISISVWMIYPQYSNGFDGFKENSEKLEKEQEKISKIKERIQNSENFFSQISSMDKKVVYSFIPEEIDEEKIIKSLNSFSNESGLLLYHINSEENKKSAKVNVSEKKEISSLPESKDFKIEINVVGNINEYEKIRDFFGKINKLERYAGLSSLKINVIEGSDSEEDKEDKIEAVSTLSFSTLDMAKLNEKNFNEESSVSETFYSDAILKIKGKRTQALSEVNVGEKGRSNIFVLN